MCRISRFWLGQGLLTFALGGEASPAGLLDRRGAQVVAIKLDQIEGAEIYLMDDETELLDVGTDVVAIGLRICEEEFAPRQR